MNDLKKEVDHYEKARTEVKLASGDYIDLKMYEPAMRHLIMHPEDVFGVKRAVISLLAGDVFRYGPVWWRLMIFRAIYYTTSLKQLRASVAAWRRRRAAIVAQPIQATDGSG